MPRKHRDRLPQHRLTLLNSLLGQAYTLFTHNNHRAALTRYRVALSVDKNSIEALFGVAISCAALNQHSVAAVYLAYANKKTRNPFRRQEIVCETGYAALNLGKPGKALFYTNAALDIDLSRVYVRALRLKALALADLERYSEAIQVVKGYVLLVGEDTWAHSFVGSAYVMLEQPHLAREHLRRASELDPNNYSVLDKLYTLESLLDPDAAVRTRLTKEKVLQGEIRC